MSSERPETEGPAPGSDVALLENAIDTLVTVLRTYGEHAFDLEKVDAHTIRERCEDWAQHVRVGTAPPGVAAAADAAASERDWRGARRFFGEQRGQESSYVTAALRDLREVIWEFVHALGNAVRDDQRTDGEVTRELERLEQAASSRSTQQLKEIALEAVQHIGRVVEERSQRQQAHVENLSTRLETMRGELDQTREQLGRDALTQVYNRAAFDERIRQMTDLTVLLGKPGYLFMIDVDDFKWINDRFGHPMGDEVLRELASCIQRSFLRREDFVSRYGGDEFAVLIQEESPEIARRLAERLLHAVRELEIGEETIRISVSIGAAALGSGEDPESWVRRADRALYAAKQSGRDRWVIDAGD